MSAYNWHARNEGVFCEPASAASVAGLLKLASSGYFREMQSSSHSDRKVRIVCVLTGHGLKDPDNAIKQSPNYISIPASVDAVLEHVAVAQ